MALYCNTYNYIKEKDIEYKGTYNFTFEPYLNESLYNTSLYGINYYSRDLMKPEPDSPYNKKEFEEIFNKRGLNRKEYDWKYEIIRFKYDNTSVYTPPNEVKINNELYLWKTGIHCWGGLIHNKHINENNHMNI